MTAFWIIISFLAGCCVGIAPHRSTYTGRRVMALHYADIRVYFKDNRLDALPDQAVENFDGLVGLHDVEGELEVGGIEVIRVFDPEGNPADDQ